MKTKTAFNRIRSFPQRILVCGLVLSTAPFAFAQSSSSTRPDDQIVRRRVDTLLNEMTLEEKIGQFSQLFASDPAKPMDDALIKGMEDAVVKGQVGSLLFVTDPAQINHLQHLAVEQSRLHIPLIFGYDVIHGFRTVFPVPIALA